jgi:hypothetical protein
MRKLIWYPSKAGWKSSLDVCLDVGGEIIWYPSLAGLEYLSFYREAYLVSL